MYVYIPTYIYVYIYIEIQTQYILPKSSLSCLPGLGLCVLMHEVLFQTTHCAHMRTMRRCRIRGKQLPMKNYFRFRCKQHVHIRIASAENLIVVFCLF